MVPSKNLEKLVSKKASSKYGRRRNAWVFGLGGLFGILLAGFFASNNGGLEKLVDFAGLQDMNLDSFLDVLPAGLIREVQDLQVSCSSVAQCAGSAEADVDGKVSLCAEPGEGYHRL